MRLVPFILFLLPYFVHAAAPSERCDRSREALHACLKTRATWALRAQARETEARAEIGVAAQRTNPMLDLQGLKATPSDPNGDGVHASLIVPLDLHGLRRARTAFARAQAKAGTARRELETFEGLRTSYLALHRIRQLRALLEIQKSMEASLAQTTAIYRKRPRLSPEQEANRTIIDLAHAEAASRVALLSQELHGFEHDIEIQIQEAWRPDASNLPAAPSRWPALGARAPLVAESAPVRLIAHTRAMAEHEAEIARVEKRGSLALGPAFEWTKLRDEQGWRAGVLVQFPLALLESHATSRELASAKQARGQAEALADQREAEGELDHNREIYEGAVAALKTFNEREAIAPRLKRMSTFLAEGLVAPATLSEALRQIYGLMQARDELELKALAAWCRIQLVSRDPEMCFL